MLSNNVLTKIPIGIVVTTESHEIKNINERAAKLLNISSGTKCRINQVHSELTPTGQKDKIIRSIHGKTLKVVWDELPEDTTGTRGYLISIIDISDHEQNKEKLSFLMKILDSMHEGILVTNCNGKVVFINNIFDSNVPL